MFLCSAVVCRPHFSFFGSDPPTPRRPFVMPCTVYYRTTHLHMLQHLHVFTSYKLQTHFFFFFFVDECMFASARVSVSRCMCWKEWVGELSHIYRPIIISLLISLCSDEINFPLWRCVCVCVRASVRIHGHIC